MVTRTFLGAEVPVSKQHLHRLGPNADNASLSEGPRQPRKKGVLSWLCDAM